MLFHRDQERPVLPETRARYERAIDAAAAEKAAIQASAAEWLRGEIKAGRLSKKPSLADLRRIAGIIHSAVLVVGANGASKANGR
jgi:hypothetical protein